MNTYSSDEFNALVRQVRDLSNKTDQMADSIALIDASVNKTKYLTKLFDVNVFYPAENDVLVYDKTGKWKNAQYDEIGLKPGEGGESNVYVIGIGDETPPTNENVYSAARTIEDWVSSKNDDIIEGNITFAEGKNLYIDGIRSRFAAEGSDTGSGLIYKVKNNGSSYLEIDELTIRKTASFNTLEIKKVTSVSGNMVISPASNNIIRVEETTQYYENSYQSVWRCIFREEIEEDGELVSQIKTDFQPGDLAKIQEFNIQTGISEDIKNRFYWGKVLGVGKNYIDLSKTDIDPSTNTQPMAGDTLVMYGHKGDTYEDLKRQNVISISTYADNAPAIQMYQGLNDYSTENKAIIELAYDSAETQQQAYMNVYGRMYVGTKDRETSYVKYDPTANDGAGLLTIKATIIVKDPNNESDVTLIEGGYIRTGLLKVEDIVANAGTISNSLKVGTRFEVDSSGNLVANNATLTSATIYGSITSTNGEIGGFKISNNYLQSGSGSSSMKLSRDKIEFQNGNYSGSSDKQIVTLGTSNVGWGSRSILNIESYMGSVYDQNCALNINCHGNAKRTYGSDNGNVAINIENGYIRGLRLCSRHMKAESDTQINNDDTVVIVTHSSKNKDTIPKVYLPTNPQEGQFHMIIKGSGHNWIRVNDYNGNIMFNGSREQSVRVNWGGVVFAVYTQTSYWTDPKSDGIWIVGTTSELSS